jgi:hypothetical protein
MKEDTPPKNRQHGNLTIGLVTIGSIATGVFGLIYAYNAARDQSDYTSAGVCLFAAAFAFGLFAIATLRR